MVYKNVYILFTISVALILGSIWEHDSVANLSVYVYDYPMVRVQCSIHYMIVPVVLLVFTVFKSIMTFFSC